MQFFPNYLITMTAHIAIIQMLLKQEVCIDFLTAAHPGSTVMPKLV